MLNSGDITLGGVRHTVCLLRGVWVVQWPCSYRVLPGAVLHYGSELHIRELLGHIPRVLFTLGCMASAVHMHAGNQQQQPSVAEQLGVLLHAVVATVTVRVHCRLPNLTGLFGS